MTNWFLIIKAFFVRDASLALSYPLDFVLKMISMVMSVFALFFISEFVKIPEINDDYGNYMAFAIVGLFVAAVTQTGFGVFSSAIRGEQTMGTLESVMMTPTRLSQILVGSASWSYMWAVIPALFMLLIGWAFFDVTLQGNLLVVLFLLILTALNFCAVGVLSASFIMVFKRGDPMGFFVGSLSMLLGGVFYPVSRLPEWMQVLANFLPITHGLIAVREILLKGASVTSVLPQIGILIIFTVLSVPLSLVVFKKAVRHAQREGTLLHY